MDIYSTCRGRGLTWSAGKNGTLLTLRTLRRRSFQIWYYKLLYIYNKLLDIHILFGCAEQYAADPRIPPSLTFRNILVAQRRGPLGKSSDWLMQLKRRWRRLSRSLHPQAQPKAAWNGVRNAWSEDPISPNALWISNLVGGNAFSPWARPPC